MRKIFECTFEPDFTSVARVVSYSHTLRTCASPGLISAKVYDKVRGPTTKTTASCEQFLVGATTLMGGTALVVDVDHGGRPKKSAWPVLAELAVAD